jgi:hypothetical protein
MNNRKLEVGKEAMYGDAKVTVLGVEPEDARPSRVVAVEFEDGSITCLKTTDLCPVRRTNEEIANGLACAEFYDLTRPASFNVVDIERLILAALEARDE